MQIMDLDQTTEMGESLYISSKDGDEDQQKAKNKWFALRLNISKIMGAWNESHE